MKQKEEESGFDMKRYFKTPEEAEQAKFSEYTAILKKALKEAMGA